MCGQTVTTVHSSIRLGCKESWLPKLPMLFVSLLVRKRKRGWKRSRHRTRMHTCSICGQIKSREIPIRSWRITRPPSNFTCRRSRSTRVLRSLTPDWPQFARRFSIFTSPPRVGEQKLAPRPTLLYGSSQILRKRTSRSASAFTGWTTTMRALSNNSRSLRVYRRAMEILAV